MARKRTEKKVDTTASTPGNGNRVSAKKTSAISSKPDLPAEARQEDCFSEVERREKIALLAYSYWLQRGGHGGSAEEDWFRAEREIASRLSKN